MDDFSLVLGGMLAGVDAILASPLVQTAVGGLVGAYAAGRAVDRQIGADREAGEKADAATIARLKLGLRVELEAIINMTSDSVGPALQERKMRGQQGSIEFIFPIESDYFTLFARNAASLGQVDRDTAAAVIEAYISLKSMVDSFRYNNQLLHEFQETQLRVGSSGNAKWAKERHEEVQTQLRAYGPLLVRSYDRMTLLVGRALDALGAPGTG